VSIAPIGINKSDINKENTLQIERHCESKGIQIAAWLPFDNMVTEAMMNGMPVVAYCDNLISQKKGVMAECR
jgi:MinD superfamily P-loop ATPase